LFGDFATAIYTDSLPGISRAQIPSRLRFTTRNFRVVFKRFADLDQSGRTPAFPFTPVGLAAGESERGTVAPVSRVYYQLTTRPNESTVGLRFSRGDLSSFLADDQVQIGIFRLP
jgi:hypothetical protein